MDLQDLDSFKKILEQNREKNKLENQKEIIKKVNGEGAANFIKNPIPHHKDSVNLLFFKEVYGNPHIDLGKTVSNKCFNDDLQKRRIIGVVQSYGMGKTKSSLMLNYYEDSFKYIVLPFRASGSRVEITTLSFVLNYQENLYKQLSNTEKTFKKVEEFSKECVRSLHLTLLARYALFRECCNKKIIDINSPSDRFEFSFFLLQGEPSLENWMVKWCNQNKECLKDSINFDNLVKQTMKVGNDFRVLYLFDEAHKFFGECRGYCLHKFDNNIIKDPKATLDDWLEEIEQGNASIDKQETTDLFYQLNCVIIEYIDRNAPPKFGFLFTSTTFSIWKKLEQNQSPLSRGMVKEYKDIYTLKEEDFIKMFQFFFNIEDSQLKQLFLNSGVKLSYFQRPHSISKFIENVYMSLKDKIDGDLLSAVTISVNNSFLDIKRLAIKKIQNLQYNGKPTKNTTLDYLFSLIYTVHRLCGGCFYLGYGDNSESIDRLIGDGVAKIEKNGDYYRITEPLIGLALEEIFSSTKDPTVLGCFKSLLYHNKILVSHDHSQKGFTLEKIIAWLFINSKFDFGIDQEEINCHLSLNKIAGTVVELDWKKSEVQLFKDIISNNLPYVVFPSTSAGADLWFCYGSDNLEKRVVMAIQSKAEKIKYAYSSFLKALNTLNINKMFKDNKEWADFKLTLAQVKYYRVVVSPMGFTDHVHYLVEEYNELYPNYKIFLIDSNQLINAGLDKGIMALYNSETLPSIPINFLLQKSWATKSNTEKGKLKKEYLKNYCGYRNLAVTGTNDQLRKSLNDYRIEEHVKPLQYNY